MAIYLFSPSLRHHSIFYRILSFVCAVYHKHWIIQPIQVNGLSTHPTYAHRLQKLHAHASPPPKREWEKDFSQFKSAKLQMQKKSTLAITCYIAALRTTTHRNRFSVYFLFVNIFLSCLLRFLFLCVYPDLFIYFLGGRYSVVVHLPSNTHWKVRREKIWSIRDVTHVLSAKQEKEKIIRNRLRTKPLSVEKKN